MISDRIKNSIDIKSVVVKYGYGIDSKNFMKCIFHEDKTNSLKLYSGNKGWHCFACSKSGSIIDFVMHIFSLDFNSAIKKIDDDFHLGLLNQRKYINRTKEKEWANTKKKMSEISGLIKEFEKIQYQRYHLLKPCIEEDLTEEYLDLILWVANMDIRGDVNFGTKTISKKNN